MAASDLLNILMFLTKSTIKISIRFFNVEVDNSIGTANTDYVALKSKTNQWANSAGPAANHDRKRRIYKLFSRSDTCVWEKGIWANKLSHICLLCVVFPAPPQTPFQTPSYLICGGHSKGKSKLSFLLFLGGNHLFQDFILFPWAGKPVREEGAASCCAPKRGKRREKKIYIR